MATKIAEIQNKSEPSEWWWIATGENPADMVTRPTRPSLLGPDSVWQRGPKFLSKPVEEWPISQALQVQEEELPDRIRVHIMTVENQTTPALGDVINLKNFNRYIKLLRVTARLILLKEEKTMKAIRKNPYRTKTARGRNALDQVCSKTSHRMASQIQAFGTHY